MAGILSRPFQRGPSGRRAFALVEVMMSMALFLAACGGLAALEISAAKSGCAGAAVGRAVVIAQNLIEEGRAVGWDGRSAPAEAQDRPGGVICSRRISENEPVAGVMRIEVVCDWSCPGGRKGVVELSALAAMQGLPLR